MNAEEIDDISLNGLKHVIFNSLRKGISFLSKSQLRSGEFPTMKWERYNVKDISYVKTIFTTSFVLHSLKHVGKLSAVI